MAISTVDGYVGAIKQKLPFFKTASRTAVANIPFSVFDQNGFPGAGTLAIGNTANGVVPTDATSGYPVIGAFSGANKGYLTQVGFNSSVAGMLYLYDCVFSAGAYAFNADVTLATQPSFSSRVPGGTDYKGLEIWIEAATAFTGNQTVQINYLDDGGAAGDTGAIATGVAPIVGRMLRIPLAAGDYGVQQITRVRSSVSTVGTFNVHIMRPLWSGRIIAANYGGKDEFLKTGMPEVYADSALRLIVQADSTATGLPSCTLEIANG